MILYQSSQNSLQDFCAWRSINKEFK